METTHWECGKKKVSTEKRHMEPTSHVTLTTPIGSLGMGGGGEGNSITHLGTQVLQPIPVQTYLKCRYIVQGSNI